MAKPPSVIVLSVIPSWSKTKTDTSSDSGIVMAVMSVARPLTRKNPRISTTNSAPSRNLNEVCLPQDVPLDQDTLGQALGELVEAALQPRGDGQRVDPWLLLDHQDHRVALVEGARAAPNRVRRLDDLRHIPHQDGHPLARRDDPLPQILGVARPPQRIDQPLLPALGEDARRRVLVATLDGLGHLQGAEVVGQEPRGLQQDLKLLGLPAHQQDL
jgi:hypothetical protein